MDTKKHISLYELNQEVKKTLKNNLPEYYWVIGEISEIKVNNSGHCYLELVEKDELTDSLRAKARAIIWSSTFRMLQPYFETTTNIKLTKGIKVLVKAIAEFHELYGFSLNIIDIEPDYTIGELARTKQETIKRLVKEGVIEMNKSLPFPLLPQKIAVISSATAAGYGDFMNHIQNNPYNYKFYIRLFPAFMQGEEAETSIVEALDKIYKYEDFFDIVVIIRGGGSQADLSCFNNYWLSYNVAQFPLPVLTGIGHEQDESVVDIVAHTKLKTPTAVAEFLISVFQENENYINDLNSRITDICLEKVGRENEKISKYALLLTPVVTERISNNYNTINLISQKIRSSCREYAVKNSQWLLLLNRNLKNHCIKYISDSYYRLEILDKKRHYLDPKNILKRGYSITLHNGKNIKEAYKLKNEDLIDTILYKGRIKSKVTK
ncbi:MAG: exodeoxyribonuclease VII large subunit [Bacteroidales bacterium]|nr:MAG: exodeoxyribonuclease VII large subunit [Bacteroidales bacterium]